MKLFVKVKTGKREARVERIDDTHYQIEVTARPEKGKANDAVIRALAKHLGLAPSRLSLITGHSSHSKVIEVL